MEILKEVTGPHGILRGVIHKPQDPVQFSGTALLLHGYFSSNRIGPSRLYVQISRILAKIGYQVWRFDCYGIGESDGSFEDASYWSEYKDYEFLISRIHFGKKSPNLVLIAHSMGTSLAMRLALNDKRINRLLIISPSFGKFSYPKNLFTKSQMKEMREMGETVRKGLVISKKNVEFIESSDIYSIAEKINIPATIIYGTSDQFYSKQSVERALKALNVDIFIKVKGGDHNFIERRSREKLLAIIEEHVMKWSIKCDLPPKI